MRMASQDSGIQVDGAFQTIEGGFDLAQPHQCNAAEMKALNEIGRELDRLAQENLRGFQVSVFETDPSQRLQCFQMLGAGEKLSIENDGLRSPPLRTELGALL